MYFFFFLFFFVFYSSCRGTPAVSFHASCALSRPEIQEQFGVSRRLVAPSVSVSRRSNHLQLIIRWHSCHCASCCCKLPGFSFPPPSSSSSTSFFFSFFSKWGNLLWSVVEWKQECSRGRGITAFPFVVFFSSSAQFKMLKTGGRGWGTVAG